MAADNQWKDKYLNALEASEAIESRLKAAEDTLRLTVSRLTLAANSSDQQLDEQLNKLRKLTKGSPDNASIRALLEQISVSIKRIDIEVNAGKPSRLSPPLFLAHLLKKIELPLSVQKKVRSLEKKLNKKQALLQLDGLVTDFVSLIADSVEISLDAPEVPRVTNEIAASQNETQVSAHELVEELFLQFGEKLSGGVSLDDARAQIAGATTKAELGTAISALISLLPINPDRAEDAMGPVHSRSTPQSALPSKEDQHSLEERFKELLDKLSLPDNLADQANKVRQQLDRELVPSDWPPLLSSIADIVAKIRSEVEKEKTEIQAFLFQVTAELQNIDSSLINTEGKRLASFNSGKELDLAVRSDLSELKSSVESESDLGNLRQIISNRMEKINRHLQKHREAETKQQEELSAEMQALRAKVKNMESETSELNEKLASEREQARTDPLTGISNRLDYEHRLEEEYQRWVEGETGLSIVVCDIDRFKHLNDSLGHQAGDKALQSIATVLKQCIRKSDFLARYGGEEFVVLVSHPRDIDTEETVGKIAEKIRAEVENADFKSKGERIPITISCGYSSFQESDTKDMPFSRADKNLYRAKESGRNRTLGDIISPQP